MEDMNEEIVLPGNNSNFNTDDLTSNTFLDEIKADNIKSTYLKESTEYKLPMYIIDLSKAGILVLTSLNGLKCLLVTGKKLEEMEDTEKSYLYIIDDSGKSVFIGCIRDYTARFLLPNYIKNAFSKDVPLFYSSDGKSFEVLKKQNVSGVKLEFDY